MGGLVDRGGVLNCQFGCSFVDLIPCTMVQDCVSMIYWVITSKMRERNSRNLRNISTREY